MDAIEALLTRRSYARVGLIQPAPNSEELGAILQSAMSVPDHGKLKPWRFVVVRGEAMQKLSSLVQQRYQDSDMTEKQLTAFVKEIANTPVMIFVCSRVTVDSRISILEQHLSGACACEHILLATHALGFAGIWHTVDADSGLKTLLNMAEEDVILGVLSIGTAKKTVPRKRPSVEEYAFEWDGSKELNKWSKKSD